jgi:S1-C subfamily serine protease
VILWQGRTATGHIEVTRVQLDSLRSVIVQLQRLQARADSQAQALRAELAAERDPSRREALRRRLGATEQRREQIAVATGVDWNAVVRANRPAVAMLYVRFPDSSMWSGTAFSVDPQGRMLTNRHLVVNEAGERAVEIAIQFSGSPEVLPARIERVSRDADLAVVRPMTAGPFPAVAGLGDAEPGEGDPIGLLGFPLGRDLPQGASPTASLFNGSISRILPDSLLQLDAWSGTGASGSPIFDRAGRVIGVEFGGIRDTGGRVVLGLPIRRARVLLGS